MLPSFLPWDASASCGSEACGTSGSELGSALGADPGQSNGDEPVDCGFGREGTGCREGVEAVARELVRRNVISDVTGLCALDQQISNEVAEVLLGPADVLFSMQERPEFGGVALVLN